MVVPKKGGIVGFTKKRLQCLQCKTVLGRGQTTVCAACADKEPLIYQKQLVVVRTLDNELWPDATAVPPYIPLMKMDVQGYEVRPPC